MGEKVWSRLCSSYYVGREEDHAMRHQGYCTLLRQGTADICTSKLGQTNDSAHCMMVYIVTLPFISTQCPVRKGNTVGRRRSPQEVCLNIFSSRNTRLSVLSRQRKSLAPAFSHGAIRSLTHIFYNSAYKVNYQPIVIAFGP